MLIDTVLACAPIVVLVPVVVTLLGSRVDYTPKAHVQKRVLESLTLAERLPEGIVGSAQIARDIDRQTMHLAYLTQYPQRGREIRDIALIGIGLVATLAVYYVLLWSRRCHALSVGLSGSRGGRRAVVGAGRRQLCAQ